jgi:tetratricopeptide (TPR) repeat protein
VVTKKDKYLAAAQKFLERGSLDKALAEFMRAVQEDPKDTRTWLRIAEIHVKRGDNEKATEVYLRTADLYVEQGFFQRAVAVYKNIVKLTPGFVEAYLKLADIYRQLGLLSDAVQQFEQASGILQRAGRVKEAMAALRQIVEINPDQPVSRIKLAEAASQAGLVEEAVAEFQRAAELLRAQGRMDEYLRVAERLLFHQPNDVVLAKEVARQYIDRNNARFALAKLQACFKVDPRDTETLEMLARAFEQLGQTGKTVSVLKELAKVYADTGRRNERMGVWKRIAALDPSDAEARDILSTRASQVPAPPPVAAPPPPPIAAVPLPVRPAQVEPPRRKREAAITFSEMAVPQFLQTAQPEPPRFEVAPAVSTAERLEIASGLLEPPADEVSAQVKRIVAEADTFVKYGLTERAADHLRKAFEYQPTHTGALERLAAVLLKLGRKGEALSHLETLAEQMALTQPEAAAGHARRALEIDPNSRRGRKVMEIVAGKQEDEDEFEELSSSLIQMETPEPEIGVEDLQDAEDSDTSFEITEGEATSITPSLFAPPTEASNPPPAVFSTATDPSLTPLDHHPDRPPIEEEDEKTNVESLLEDQPTRAFDPQHDTPASEFELSERTTGDDGTYAAMFADLEQVDFFIEQGIPDEARALLDDVIARYPPSPLLDERRRRIEALEAGAAPGAVPVEPGSVGHGQANPGSISPKAMVAAGGEMDLESHRDLGIGYKDMGLFDAAIREFSLLVKDPRHEVFGLTMIGECHESKGGLADAVAFYKKALNKPAISDAEATALYYQLGSVFQTMGETNEALYFFEKVMKRDGTFRDVRRRITDLRGGEGGRGALLGKNQR